MPGVRVRANEVRKRLAAHYSALPAQEEFSFDLPIGSYVPRFFRSADDQASADADVHAGLHASAHNDMPPPTLALVDERPAAPPLSLYQLAVPTLVALFLCVICIRWQVAQEHPFASFWGKVFSGHASVLYLPEATYGPHGSMTEIQAMQAAAPLLNLAGQFHAHFKIVNVPDASPAENSVLVALGESSSRPGQALTTGAEQVRLPDGTHSDGNRSDGHTSGDWLASRTGQHLARPENRGHGRAKRRCLQNAQPRRAAHHRQRRLAGSPY